MARGKATFGTMKSMDVQMSDTSDAPKIDMNLDEGMRVKAFSNANFQYSMGARNKLRQRQNKPKPAKQPMQPVQAQQMNPGQQRIVTPPKNPEGGRKPQSKGWKRDALTLGIIPVAAGAIGGDLANRVQDRRTIKREDNKLGRRRSKKTKGFLSDLLGDN